ncbi:cation diffusion facilitator family transporter [Sphingobium sp. RSMS]|uniref:cation diffusion facilitator family transporter n=1 Tax=Sphingobium sp. RSMS TaxID=520734 RepID=UPI0010F886E8|nr:cation diffusion facilitator family transporter [Sphingobium sp. RSMS]UXC91455.1 cation diffusion facilitator family transporter [Sphingobium sp. RSMS]
MADAHAHRHDHGEHVHSSGAGEHAHAPATFGRAFAIGICLNVAFVATEVIYGLTSRSLALLADAGHNLSDVAGLGIAWAAIILARKLPNRRFTYGLTGTSILAALANGILLMLAAGAIAVEAVQRFGDPQPVTGNIVMIVAGIWIAINTATALLFMSGRKSDVNIRGAFLHMAADAAVSAGVVIAGLAIRITGWNWLDPVVSLAIVAVIVRTTWGLLREATAMSLSAAPATIDTVQVRQRLQQLDGVEAVHDLHIWAMSTTETALTAHLVMPGKHEGDRFLHDTAQMLKTRFNIGHSTLQVEHEAAACALQSDRVI